MGFIRGVLKGIAGMLFIAFLSVLLMNIVLYEATKPDVLKPFFSEIISKNMDAQGLGPIYNDAVSRCKTQSYYNIENFNISLSCSKIKTSSQAEFLNIFGEEFFNKIYERQCQDAGCLKLQDFPGFVTRSFNLFLADLIIMTAILTAVFAFLLFLLSSGWQSKFSSLGIPMILLGIPALPLEFFKSKIYAGELQFLIGKIIDVTIKYSLICLAIGILLVAASLLIKSLAKKEIKGGKKKRKKK